MHEAKFDDMEVSVRLDVHTHPDFYSTEGHCLYTMVRQCYRVMPYLWLFDRLTLPTDRSLPRPLLRLLRVFSSTFSPPRPFSKAMTPTHQRFLQQLSLEPLCLWHFLSFCMIRCSKGEIRTLSKKLLRAIVSSLLCFPIL